MTASSYCGLPSLYIVMTGFPSTSNCWLSHVNICLCVPINPCILKSFPVVGSDVALAVWPERNTVCLEEKQNLQFHLPFGHIASPDPAKTHETNIVNTPWINLVNLFNVNINTLLTDVSLFTAAPSVPVVEVINYCS